LIFDGIQLAGQLIGFQMGFSIVNVIDPVNNEQVSIIAQFQYLIAMLVFLIMNGHHIFLYAIAESFRIIPPLGFHFSGELMQSVVVFVKNMLEVAIKTGAPIIAVLLFTSVGMGLIARTVPQINIFIVGFPLQIAIGLVSLGVTLPIFLRVLGGYFSHLEVEIISLLRLMN
ncbi:MAG: flagellar biosynthetic protein FliR, partial [Syntrophaceae bacterium]|nr:flagellar biosynthetic protein FliR [Syntrophaceae bacterium]